ncbi:3-deoxy-D-manno-octulosonate 8-phosphate phosphatase KdsC [Pandoraea cepalis]|uniref:3-deoxy-D-manno-octulosonate 8-phosphate phosphatase KdsC n=2 Tax=Burkholderiaceae TaxID=119060 RepID=A0A5E4S4A2_9BURK|nr:3-deoxy-D-manno-octulosonate 8-phosphate phosphatase [Pandoraea sp. XY-2]BDD91398.1 3-deoxy-D-manno-octulosonate 8-phosphate phosphatase [Pandoraea sp. NE5]VVD69542.1 3-deoxy-D-manno-octulosonate 8-phosphate phosphatase KdsC [Pandoraea cepalis]VVD71539.1 3-deoxy-D-manno-octulosonate 8-phosphate phosphatase KdsC [Pandoraea cepalis]
MNQPSIAQPTRSAPLDATDVTDAAARAARLRVMVFDVDGVLTDGGLRYGPAGEVIKTFDSLDGHGLKLLAEVGIVTAIITGRQSEIVAKRAADLRVAHVYQGVQDKRAAFEDLCAKVSVTSEVCGHIGDDWPDLPILSRVGFAACPANAHAEVRARCHWVAATRGGEGAVRELCDFILRAQGRYDALLADALA